MPTRLPTYLLSGTPVFLYSPPDSALARFATKYEAVYFVGRQMNADALADQIMSFSQNDTFRRELGIRARQFAKQTLSGSVVRPRFRKVIESVASQGD